MSRTGRHGTRSSGASPIHAALVTASILFGLIGLTSCKESGSGQPTQGGAAPSPGGNGSSPGTRLTPAQIEDALVAASRYVEQGEPVKAEIILADLVTKAPGLSRAHELLGKAAFHQAAKAEQGGDEHEARRLYAAAADHYDEAVRLDAMSAGLACSAGEIAIRAGRVERAIEHLRAAGRLDPADPRAPMLEASMLLTLRRIPEARTAIDRAFALDPDEPYILATLAAVLAEEGDQPAALRTIRQARGLAPASLQTAFRALEAKFLRQSGEPAKALELLLPLSPAVQQEESVTTEIAAAYAALGQPDRAAEVWVRRYESTRDWRAAVEVARYAAKAGLMDEAWRWHRTVQMTLGDHHVVKSLAEELRQAPGQAGGG
ncbi:MAG: tetratricopeptide repeat protein [Phycisphaeraceae bacterium]|nr:tetratricopeptide repeat protein [Phycisphaerales bacterium]QOJ19040.1 MAG: tetratricopeptide repeat protein [Phycisphaeraceae bacterium]